jgi:two-component system, cell cycle sensor histidine kinase and response regulator CckA
MGIRSAVLLALLIALGFLGNYYSLPLFFGADFLFGSIAVLLVLYFYGLGWGMLSALVAYGYTWVLWGHPYGCINFMSEALFVGLFLKCGRRNLLLLDAIFWLLLGMPLAWLYHGFALHMDATTVTFVTLKQATNGVFNAMLASLAVYYLPLGKLFRRPQLSALFSLRDSLFSLLVMLVLLPSLVLTMVQARNEKADLESEVIVDLKSVSANLQFHLHSWFQQQVHGVTELAKLASISSTTPAARLQHYTEILNQAFPNFKALHVENEFGRTIAFSPRVNEKGGSTIGHDFSDRFWFKECKVKKQPVISELFCGRIAVFAPLVVVAVPIMREDHWLGTATGTLDLGMIREMLKPYSARNSIVISLLDFKGQIIASTAPDRSPMQSWERQKTGEFRTINASMYHWYPESKHLPSMTRWKQSLYVQEISLKEPPWKLIIEMPLAPLQHTLYTLYVKNLTYMAILTGLALLFSLLLSRYLSKPLLQLSHVTAQLPENLSEARNLDWPASSTLEINALIANSKAMAQALEDNFHSLQVQSDELRQINLDLNRAIHERQRAEEEIVHLASFPQLNPYPVIEVNTEGTITYYNNAALQASQKLGLQELRPFLPVDLDEILTLNQDQETRAFRREIKIRDTIYSMHIYYTAQFRTARLFYLDITKHRQAEEALQKSEERFRAAFDATPFPVAVVDWLGEKIHFWSHSALTLFGHTAPTTAEWYQLAYPDPNYRCEVIDRWKPLLEIARESRQTVNAGEFRVTCSDGSERLCELYATFVLDVLMVTFNDITARKDAEAALLQSQALLSTVLKGAPIGIGLAVNRTFQWVNDRLLQMLGYSREEVIGHNSRMLYPGEDEFNRVADVYTQIMKNGWGEMDLQWQHKDGHLLEVFLTSVAVNPGDLSAGVVFTAMDITERKRAEEAFNSLVSYAPMGIYIVQDGKFAMINPGFEVITGYHAQELIGQHCLDPVSPEYRAFVREQALLRLKDQGLPPYEYQFITKDGKTGWVMETVTPTQYQGKPAVMGYFMDISPLKKLEAQFLQAQKMEAVGRLAGGVAHDFNNMLGIISGHAEMVLLGLKKHDPLYSHLEEIRKAAERSALLTRQLLAFSRKQILEPRVINLNNLVTELEKMFYRLMGEDIELVKVFDPVPTNVKVDPGQMEQLIMNLVVNARDAMPRGGKLIIETQNVTIDETYVHDHHYATLGPHVLLAVSDNGLGMDADTRAHVFEPFFTTKETGKGTGLGLSTVYGIVKQSGGSIEVYSELGRGTTFKIYLPRVEEPAAALKAEVFDAPLEGSNTILVVEDEDTLRALIIDVLEMYGYKVLEARNGSEALLICEQHPGPIDLMLTDVVLPRMNGRELADRLAPLRPEIKVLFMSGYTETAILHPGGLRDDTAFIQKPFSPANLAQKVKKVLGTSPV